MRVSKWGKSLAIRLPEWLVEALGLKAGDDLDVVVLAGGRLQFTRKNSREQALERLRALKRPLPEGFRFNRGDATER
jgi:antitoxin MazE